MFPQPDPHGSPTRRTGTRDEIRRVGDWLTIASAFYFANASPASGCQAVGEQDRHGGSGDRCPRRRGTRCKTGGGPDVVPGARTVLLPSISPLRALDEVLRTSGSERIVLLAADATPTPEAFAAQVLHAADKNLDACLQIADPLIYEPGPAAWAIPATLFTRSALEKVPRRLTRTETEFWAIFSSNARVGGMPPERSVERPSKDLTAALIDPNWYLAMNPDIAAPRVEPVDHFLNTGWRERRNPNPWFHTAWYLGKNQEVLARDINPLWHFVIEGAARLQPSPGFDIGWYSRQYLNTDRPCAKALLHFMNVGLSIGAIPYPRLRVSPARGKAPRSPFSEPGEHLLQALVDAAWYRANYALKRNPSFNAAAHYFERGWRLGYNPNPWFDTSWYLSQNPKLGAATSNPFRGLGRTARTTASPLSSTSNGPPVTISAASSPARRCCDIFWPSASLPGPFRILASRRRR
jgi:hypothetical protein